MALNAENTTAQNGVSVTNEGGCQRFNSMPGNGAQPKTNYCSTCAAHKTALCAKLSGEELAEFGALSQHKTFAPGQTLFNEFDEARYYYTVVSGDVRLSRMLDDGRRQITGFKSKGDFIGLGTDGHFSSDAEAINEVVVCQFTVSNMNHSLENFSAVQGRLMEMMQHEVIALQDHMLLLGRKTPVEKIANFLCERAKKYADVHPEDEMVQEIDVFLPMSRTDVADFLGLTIETVSRTITKLRKAGVIELETAQHVVIKDFEELSMIADGEV